MAKWLQLLLQGDPSHTRARVLLCFVQQKQSELNAPSVAGADVQLLERTLPPCAASYLRIAGEYRDLGRIGRCLKYFDLFREASEVEKEPILRDKVASSLVAQVETECGSQR